MRGNKSYTFYPSKKGNYFSLIYFSLSLNFFLPSSLTFFSSLFAFFLYYQEKWREQKKTILVH